jgi:hypothetical protein
MTAKIIERSENKVTIQIEIPLSRSMLDTEATIQATLNAAGVLASAEALKQFDTDGSALDFGSHRFTSKGLEPKIYQTPYGEVCVDRHVYQSSKGGTTFCPLEHDARIILTSTPRFAMQISNKYAEMPAARVVKDLSSNSGRDVSVSFVQDTAAAVASIAQIKEESWQYSTPKLDKPISTVSIGLDGTCMLLLKDGNRQAMVGTVSLYDSEGTRQHTIYLAAAPEYGKETFLQRLTREINHVKTLYPQAHVTAIADGSADNWNYLREHSKDECIDFYHVTTYLTWIAKARHPGELLKQEKWKEQCCHKLKNEKGYAEKLKDETQAMTGENLSQSVAEELERAKTYLRNHYKQMNYAERMEKNLPIGSGVTEGACKTMVKMRMCRGGAKWTKEGAGEVLSLRTLVYTEGRWGQFWAKIDRFGLSATLAA